ncbi:MAG: M14 family metallopeptidase [Candidatus Thiodiazotropha sp.]
MLHEIEYLPEGLLQVQAEHLSEWLQGPTLIHLPGQRPAPLFVSVLMHGNETVGWEAVRRLLARYEGGRALPRAISLFIGNVKAAAFRVRRLPGQPDFNRVWPGGEEDQLSPEAGMMARVVEIMREREPFASIDVHNNTGLNPHYACVNRLDTPFLHLALLFGRTVVYFLRPRGVQSMAFAELCPAVTLECGKVGQAHGVEHAEQYLEASLHLAEHPQHPVTHQDIDLFHTVARVTVSPQADIGFAPAAGDIVFEPDLDRLNFQELLPGTPLGRINGSGLSLLDVRDEQGRDVLQNYLALRDGRLFLQRTVMPSMLTKDIEVIRQDCLCYLMERYGSHL